jgi:hypothetical protein
MNQMSITSSPARPSRIVAFVAVPLLVAMAACNATAPTTTPLASEVASEPPVSDAASAATTPSASSGPCLDADVVAALDEIRGGNFDTDPPREGVADALDTIQLDGDAAAARDSLADALRDADAEAFTIVSAAQALAAQVALPEC